MKRLLTDEQREIIRPLLKEIQQRLANLSGGDAKLLFAYRRYLTRALVGDEKAGWAKTKAQKRIEQKGICPICHEALPDKDAVLDRIEAWKGYTMENTRLIHRVCDSEQQRMQGFQ